MTVQEDPGGITPVITERQGSATTVTQNNVATATATCNAGEVNIGGGATMADTHMTISESSRSGTTGWTITCRNNHNASKTFTPRVVCLQVPMGV